VFRGDGGQGNAYAGISIAGEGRYYAFRRTDAERYGGNIEERPLDLENPLVIDSDNAWRELTKAAGWDVPNPYGMPPDEVRAMTAAVKQEVQRRGHDGMVVAFDPETIYDVDPRTQKPIKLIRNVFDVPQAVDYRSARATDATGAAARPTDQPPAAQAETGSVGAPDAEGLGANAVGAQAAGGRTGAAGASAATGPAQLAARVRPDAETIAPLGDTTTADLWDDPMSPAAMAADDQRLADIRANADEYGEDVQAALDELDADTTFLRELEACVIGGGDVARGVPE
jgi:hypothetical protein